MKGKVDEDCEDSRDEEVVEVDKDESEGDEAEQAGGEDEGQQPETPTEGGKPATTLNLVRPFFQMYQPCCILRHKDSGGTIVSSCLKVM